MALLHLPIFLFEVCGSSLFLFDELFSLLFLLVIGDTLQSEEVLTRLLIQLLLNVADGEVDSGNDDEFECIDSSVSNFDDFVESDELGLQGGDVDQVFQELLESVAALLDRLTTPSQTQHRRVLRTRTAHRVTLQHELRQMHTGHVLRGHIQTHESFGAD